MQQAINLLLGILTTYGISTMMSDYDGPDNLFRELRAGKRGKLFQCNVCLSPFIALIPVLFLSMGFIEYLAIIGGSVLLARNT